MRNVSWNRRSGAARANPAIGLLLLGAVVAIVVTLLNRESGSERDARTGAKYLEQAREASAIDPALVTWEEVVEPVDVPMDFPVAIAVGPGDLIHVAGDRIVILEQDHSIRLRSDSLPQEYHAVSVDESGRIYSAGGDQVHQYQAGTQLHFREGWEYGLGPGINLRQPVTNISSIAAHDEVVYVADALGRKVYRVLPGPEGGTESVIARDFNVPSTMDITVNTEGELVTVDPGRHQVQVRDAYGDVVKSFGENGNRIEQFHGCCNPIAIALLSDGRWVTAEKGLGVTRVKVYSAGGEFESVVAGPDQFDEPKSGPPIKLDLAVDSEDRILVLDPARKQVRTFTPKQEGSK